MKKDPLGKGLSAILQDLEEQGTTRSIPVAQIVPNPTQPRTEFREASLTELAASIKEKGVLQPILLRKKAQRYEIIAGERRYRAAVTAGLTEVPAIIKEVSDREALEISLIENLQREDLTSIEIAAVYERFIEEFSYTQQNLADKIGIDRSSIANYLRLLKLPDWIKQLVREGKLTQGHARALLGLDGEKEQKAFVHRVLHEGATVRELERAVKKEMPSRQSSFTSVEDTLRDTFQTKVNITYRKNRGKIIIEFYSREDLERIVEIVSHRLE
jgi:ParB family chromosome partitioning protein